MKALRQAKRRTLRNAKVKAGIDYLRKSVRKAMEAKDAKKAQEFAKDAIKAIDKAVQKSVLKRNTGARLKSRMTKAVNALVKAAKK